jgi:hypothetical protein
MQQWGGAFYREGGSNTRLANILQAPSIGFFAINPKHSCWLVAPDTHLETVQWHRQASTERLNEGLFAGPAGKERRQSRVRRQRQNLGGLGRCKKTTT